MASSTNISHARDMSEYPRVQLQSLDKITARTVTFDTRIGDTLKFGNLYIRVQSCQKSSPIDEPESAAFLQIWEKGVENKSQWVFSGWMFSSSPGLSHMDHPVYDVWVLDCLEDKEISKSVQLENSASEDNNDEDGVVSEDPPENKVEELGAAVDSAQD